MTQQEHTNVEDGSEGQRVNTVRQLKDALTEGKVAVLENEINHNENEGMVHVNNYGVMLAMVDPWPEYREWILEDGKLKYKDDLLKITYEGVFRDHMEAYGHAYIYPIDQVPDVEEGEYGTPEWVGDTHE